MAYNILGIRTPSDPFDPLYPTLTDGAKGFQTVGNDGRNILKWPVVGVSVLESDGRPNLDQVGSFFEGTPTVFLTDVRVALVHHNFKTADRSYLTFGLDSMFLASKALAKVRTHNRAVAGHMPLISLSRISVKPAQKNPRHGVIRLYMIERTEGEPRVVVLQVTMTSVDAALDLAQGAAQRYASCWLRGGREDPALFDPLREAARLQPIPDKWVSYRLPRTVHLDAGVPARVGIKSP
jgi:hypothetical protein